MRGRGLVWRLVGIGIAILSSGTLSHDSGAQEGRWQSAAPETVPPSPEEPTAAKAYAVFDRACAQCHQAGRLQVSRVGGGLGDILNLARLARDDSKLTPGHPDGSPLYMFLHTRTGHETDAAGKPLELSAADIDAVREWIRAMPPSAGCSDRVRLPLDAETASVGRLREGLAEADRPHVRFLSLAHMHNACATSDEIKAARHGAVIAVNSLSWGLKPVTLEPVDDTGTILKLDLRDIGWDAARWSRLVSEDPYKGNSDRSTSGGGAVAYRVRADWFAAAAMKGPLYYDLLGLPDRQSTLLSSLRIDESVSIAQARVRRIGLKTSKVARGSRLLQRVPFANGSFWTSYEYAPTPGRVDVFDAPSGPGVRGAAKPDATLSMFSLPSGFSAFYVANGEGVRMTDIPASVLRDDAHPSRRVTVGSGCMACHAFGTRPAVDELRERTLGDTAIPRDIRERIAALHGTSEEMQRLFAEDENRIAGAFAEAGLVPGTRTGGLDELTALITVYERDVSRGGLAAELGVPADALEEAAARANGAAADLLQRVQHAVVSRREVEHAFVALRAAVLKSGEAPAEAPMSRASAGEGHRLIMKTAGVRYKVGDAFAVTVRTTESCYLTLINVDRAGRATVIYPNDFDTTNFLEAEKDLKVPADGAPFVFRLRDQGRETVVGICHTQSRAPPGIKHDFERQRFTELGDFRAFLNRTSGNESDGQGAVAPRPAETSRTRRRGRNAPAAAQTTGPAAGRPDSQARASVIIDIVP